MPRSKFSLGSPSSRREFAERAIIACLLAISWYNVVELIAMCFTTFKRYGGFYFWCLLVASFSIIPFGIGYLLIVYNIYSNLFPVAMELIAWVGMVTGQSLVLWSRLHFICHSSRIIRGTLAMIIVDAVIYHIPGSVLELGSHSNRSSLFLNGFAIFERIQLIGFSVQEVILSTIYAWEAARLLNLRPRGRHRNTLLQLVVMNLVMILMDAAVIAVQYSDFFDIQVTLKAMVYSIKLKLEYAILGKLVAIADVDNSTAVPTDLSDFVDLSFHQTRLSQLDGDFRARFASDNSELCVRVPSKGSSADPLRRRYSASQSHSPGDEGSL